MSERLTLDALVSFSMYPEGHDCRAMAEELLARRQAEVDLARTLCIDMPEPGSPLAIAFAASESLRKERDSAYGRGRAAAKAEALNALDKVRAALSGEPCKCGGQGRGLDGFHYPHAPGCRL